MIEGRSKDDFVRYIFRLEVVADDAPQAPRQEPATTRRPDDPVQGSTSAFIAAAAARQPAPSAARRRASSESHVARGTRARGGQRAGAGREDAGSQRAVLLRERQEVQAVPRLAAASAGTPVRDFTEELAEAAQARPRRRAAICASPRDARSSRRARDRSRANLILWDDAAAGAQGHHGARRALQSTTSRSLKISVRATSPIVETLARARRAKRATIPSGARARGSGSTAMQHRPRSARAPRSLFTGVPTTRAMRSVSRQLWRRVAPMRRTGPRCSCACSRAGPNGAGSPSSCEEVNAGHRSRLELGDVHGATAGTRMACSPARSGVHRLIRISPFDCERAPPDRVRRVRRRPRAGPRRRLPEIDPSDLRIDTFRSSGAPAGST